ncbi:MAG: DUF6379 domain-containing protein [Bacteroidales bacterium]|jgi:hypothetical protein|nr:DUF6379 domain-containing protein [Bacteroidales bacterium]
MPAGKSFLINEGMISDTIKLIVFEGKKYISITIRNQLLHGIHPLGAMNGINIKIDSKPIPQGDVYFVIRNQWIGLEQIHTIKDIYWHIIEEIQLNIKDKNTILPGSHEIECEFVFSLLDISIGIDEKRIWSFKQQTVIQKAVY